MKNKTRIPKNHPVQPLKPGAKAMDRATCGTCGLSWDDAIITSMTPAPSGRCPFEECHDNAKGEVAPEKWKAHGVMVGDTKDTLGGMFRIVMPNGDFAFCTNEAHRHVIAAAPDLLKVCQLLVNCQNYAMNRGDGMAVPSYELRAVLSEAGAAIAKAEGK